MAKARWIKPEFFTDPKLSRVSDAAALLYPALWCEADDGGVAHGDPRIIYGRCFITRAGWTVEKVAAALDELLNVGVIQRGTHQDQTWLFIPNLMKNQGLPPKKWRHLGETEHPKLIPLIFSESPRKPEKTGECVELTPKPSPSYSPKPIAVLVKDTVAPSALETSTALVPIPKNGNGGHPARSMVQIREHLASVLAEVSNGTRERMDLDAMRDTQAELIFAYWQAKHGHEGALLDTKRTNRLKSRLGENGGNVHELLFVVDGARRDPNLMGKNEHNRKYDGIETLYRDRGQVERLAELGGFKPDKTHPMADKYLAAVEG